MLNLTNLPVQRGSVVNSTSNEPEAVFGGCGFGAGVVPKTLCVLIKWLSYGATPQPLPPFLS